MDSDLDFDQTQAVVISDLEDDDLTDDLDSSAEKEPCAYLRVLPQNDLPGSSYPVYEGDNIIGRNADTCHVCISSKSLSKEHACIEIAAGSHLIFDKGSRNKTRRGKLILKPEIRYELKHGDVISFADVKCVYEIMKQMSEIVPESDAETDADSDVSESLNLRHDVTDQSDKMIDLTGDHPDSSNRDVSKTSNSVQHTLILSESDSEDDDVPSEHLKNNQPAVQETLVFESSDDEDALDLIGMATQAYTKIDFGKDNQKPGKPSKMIAETQKYFNQPAELMETQSFDLDSGSEEEGTACSGGIRSESIGCNVSKAATKSSQGTHKDSEEHSDDASELFALSTLACDYVVDVDNDGDGSCEEGPPNVVKAIADKNLSARSSTVTVPSDATVAVCSDATVAIPSDTTVAVPSDASVGIKSPSKRFSKRVLSKSVVSPVKVSSLRLAETLIAEDVVTASETRPGDSDDMATQIFDETIAVGGSSSQNAAMVSRKKLARYPSDIACSDGAAAPVEDVFPVSGKIFAGNRSKATQKCISDEPTQVFDVTFDEPTQAFSAISDEPTQAYGGISFEPTQAYGFSSDEPTQDYSGISNEPTQIFHDTVEKPTQFQSGISNKPTQILDDSSDKATQLLNDSTDMATQLLNDSTEKPTQVMNDASDEPTQVHNNSYDEPTQTFITDSDDSDKMSIPETTKSRRNLRHGKDQPATADGSVGAGQRSDKTTENSAHALTMGDNNMQRRVSVVESDEDVDATQAFVDEGEEDDESYAGKAEDPTQRYLMEAEERLEKAADLANFPKGSTDATSRNQPDSSDDSDLEESSVLKSVETLPDDPAHLKKQKEMKNKLFESTSTSLSTNAEPTLRYDMAIDKDPTLPYDMAIDKDPTLPYDMGVEELPGKAKRRQSPKRKAHKGSEHNGSKELDSSADTKKVSDGTNPCPEFSSPVIPLPTKSSLKPALVDRRRSPSPSPGNRHVAFAVTVNDDKVDQQISAGGSANTRQAIQSQKSDQDILSPTRPGRVRNKRSLQHTTAFEQSNDQKSQGEIIKPGQLNLTSQIPENLLGVEQSKVDDLEIQGQKSGINAQKTSTRAANRSSTQRSKVQFSTDVKTVSDTPSLADDINSVDSTPPILEDVNPLGSTPPLVEDTSKKSLTPQAGNRRRKISDNQGGDDTTPAKESGIIVASASKRGRKSVVMIAEDAVESAGGRRSSARPKKMISYQQLATGVEKKQDKRSAGPSEKAENEGVAALNSVRNSSNKASKKSAVLLDDSNTAASKKSATSLDDSSNKAGKKSAVSLDDSNTTPSKKSVTALDDSSNKAGKKSAISLDDSNMTPSKKSVTAQNDGSNKASKKSTVSLDDSNMTPSKKSATSLDDSSNKASKKSATPSKKSATSLDDSSNKASKKSAVSLDDSNTTPSKKSVTALNDSSNKASKKSAISLDDSNMTPSKKSATSLDDSSNKAGKKSAVSLDDSNTAASKKSAISLDDSNTTPSKKSATSLDDSSNKASKKSASSLDDSNAKASQTLAASLDDGNTKASKKSAASLHDSNTRASKKSTASLNDSNTRASRKSVASSDDSNTNTNEKSIEPASKTSVISLDDSNTKDKKHSVKSLANSNTTASEKPIKPVDDSNNKVSTKLTRNKDESNTKASKASVKSLVNSKTLASEQHNTRRQRPTKQPQENIAKKDSKKPSVRKSARPKTEEKDDTDSDETASIASFVDGSTVIDDETPITVMDGISGKDHEQWKTGMSSERIRKSRTTRTARESDAKEASRKGDNHGVSSDTVSTTSRKRLHSEDPEADREGHQLENSSAVAQNEEIHAETRRKKRSVAADDPGKDSSSTAVYSTPKQKIKNMKSRSSKAAQLDGSSENQTSVDKNVSKHNSQESIGSQEQTNAGTTSRIGTRKSLQVEEKGKRLSPKQDKTQTSNQAVRDTSRKASEVYSKPQTEEVQAPASRGKRATRSVISSAAAVDCPGSEISRSEFVSSPSQKSTSARKPAHTAVKPSDIKSRGRKSGRAEPMISENDSNKEGHDQNSAGNDSDKEGHDQNSASEQDKSSQVSVTQKTKFVHQSAMEKDVSSQNATNLKRRRATDSKLSQDSSQSNENKEQIAEQISTPRAKKSKQMPVPRTPTGKVHMENVDSPILRKTLANCKPHVMFTGYLDKQGEKIVRDLGGELVTTVQECSHLVTDRICRTVKFLSGLAKGLLIVSPRWLESCKQAGTFVDGHQFLVSDPATEKQYKFNLATSINKAQAGPLLAGYKVHVTKSVKPDPAQMQDILKFAGAQYMKTMPNKSQEKLVVISCPEDESLCQPAVKAGIPVVGAEFILTGILRQEIDLESFSLFHDESKSQKKTGKKK